MWLEGNHSPFRARKAQQNNRSVAFRRNGVLRAQEVNLRLLCLVMQRKVAFR